MKCELKNVSKEVPRTEMNNFVDVLKDIWLLCISLILNKNEQKMTKSVEIILLYLIAEECWKILISNICMKHTMVNSG